MKQLKYYSDQDLTAKRCSKLPEFSSHIFLILHESKPSRV
jgi:hypothetical protein